MSFQRFDAMEPKRCRTCGRTYDDVQWQALPLVGHQVMEPYAPENDPGEVLELRNCSCRSTLAVLEPFTALDLEREVERERGLPLLEARQRAIARLKGKR